MKKLHNPIKSLKASKFFDLVKERTHNFKMGSEKPIPTEYPVNALARKLHPDQQFVKIAKIQDHGMNCKTFTFVPDKEKGCQELAYFSSGQYITIFLKINNFNFSRPYSLSSAPKESLGLQGFYQITVKSAPKGLVSNYILENWKVGMSVELSAPEGNFDYVDLRDAQTVVGIAGGSGITPFLSYAKAICSGDENFNMILLYGSRDASSILFKNQFELLEKQTYKIKVVNILSNAQDHSDKNFEYGFVTVKVWASMNKDILCQQLQ